MRLLLGRMLLTSLIRGVAGVKDVGVSQLAQRNRNEGADDMTIARQATMAHHFFLSILRTGGYSEPECEAISRGMTVSSFRGEMPRDKKRYDKLITSWLELGRLQ
jgi:hypothetical protein